MEVIKKIYFLYNGKKYELRAQVLHLFYIMLMLDKELEKTKLIRQK